VAARNTLSERGVFVLGLWNVATGEEASLPEDPDHIEHTGVISAFAFSPDGRHLATASMDYSIRLWDFERRQRLATFHGHLSEVWAVTFSPDGQAIVSGAKDGSVKWWPVRPPVKEDVVPGSFLPPLAISPDSHRLAAAHQGAIVFFNLATLEREQEIPLGNAPRSGPARPPAAAFSQDLTLLAHAHEDGRVQLWHTTTGESTTFRVSERGPQQVALSPDGRALVTSGFGRSLRWWDLRSGTNVVLETEARRAFFSPDGRILAGLAGWGSNVELWDTTPLTLRTNVVSEVELPGEVAAAFSPDSRLLAVACADDTVRLWDTTTGAPVGICAGHKQSISSVAFAPDGKTLATASDDNTIKLWNVATQQELLTIRRLGGALRTLLFSPDGRLLVGRRSSVSPTGGLGIYRTPSFEETDAGRATAKP
jgi:WD40 repeat protein